MVDRRALSARGAARRTALLDAAVSVVAAGGAGSLTHRAVATKARVSLASVTYHFPSIEQLRRSTFDQALTVLDEVLAGAVHGFGGTIERMPRVFAEYIGTLLTRHRDAVITVNEMIVAATHDGYLRATFHDYQDKLAGLLDPCVGGAEAGRTVAAALQGLLLSASAYETNTASGDVSRWRDAAVDLINRVRVH